MNTPNIFGGGSSAIHTVGGMTPRSPGWASPSFTPAHGARDMMMFTPPYNNAASPYNYDMSQRSPSKTPFNLPSQTPHHTPHYIHGIGSGIASPGPIGSSYYNRSDVKSPSYNQFSNSPNSPSYSYNSSMRNSSQSPNYSNSQRDSPYGHSPSYSPVGEPSRVNETIKEDEDDNEDEPDDF